MKRFKKFGPINYVQDDHVVLIHIESLIIFRKIGSQWSIRPIINHKLRD